MSARRDQLLLICGAALFEMKGRSEGGENVGPWSVAWATDNKFWGWRDHKE